MLTSERRKSLQHRPDTAHIDLSIKNLVKLPRDGEADGHIRTVSPCFRVPKLTHVVTARAQSQATLARQPY